MSFVDNTMDFRDEIFAAQLEGRVECGRRRVRLSPTEHSLFHAQVGL